MHGVAGLSCTGVNFKGTALTGAGLSLLDIAVGDAILVSQLREASSYEPSNRYCSDKHAACRERRLEAAHTPEQCRIPLNHFQLQ